MTGSLRVSSPLRHCDLGVGGGLQQRLVEVELEPVDAFDLEGDMLGEGFGDVACYSHGAGSGRWAPHSTVMIRALSQSR